MKNNFLFRHALFAFLLLVRLTSPVQAQPDLPAYGAVIAVTASSDDLTINGNCTLREAILAANNDQPIDACPAGSGSDLIELPAGQYTLALPGPADDDNRSGDLDISAPLALQGAGAHLAVVNGSGMDRVFHILAAAGQVRLSGMTIENGITSDADGQPGGGGILNEADLSIEDVILQNNGAAGHASYQGGGVFNAGQLSLLRVIVQDNFTEIDGLGGGIANRGQLIITDSQVLNNHTWDAAGLFNAAGASAEINASRFQNNTAANWGGGITSNGRLQLSNSVVSANISEQGGGLLAGGGESIIETSQIEGNQAELGSGLLVKSGQVSLNEVAVRNNQGRGASVLGGLLRVEQSTVNGNQGGISVQAGQIVLTNSTLSGNQSNSDGAGLLVAGGEAQLDHVTITANQILFESPSETNGGGIAVTGGLLSMHNSLVAGNYDHSPAQFHPDIFSLEDTVQSAGYNLIGLVIGPAWPVQDGDQVGTPADPLDANLADLAENGGPTQTHLPRTGSLAIDTSDPNVCPSTDQRGLPRPAGSTEPPRCDIGAVEVQTGSGQLAAGFFTFLPFIQ